MTVTSSHLVSFVAGVSLEARQTHGTLQDKGVAHPATSPPGGPHLAHPDLPGDRGVPLGPEPPTSLVHPARDPVWERGPPSTPLVPKRMSPSWGTRGTSPPQPLTHGGAGDPPQPLGARPARWSLCPHGARLPGWPLGARLSLGTRGQSWGAGTLLQGGGGLLLPPGFSKGGFGESPLTLAPFSPCRPSRPVGPTGPWVRGQGQRELQPSRVTPRCPPTLCHHRPSPTHPPAWGARGTRLP